MTSSFSTSHGLCLYLIGPRQLQEIQGVEWTVELSFPWGLTVDGVPVHRALLNTVFCLPRNKVNTIETRSQQLKDFQ
jgi:hypothetical protein